MRVALLTTASWTCISVALASKKRTEFIPFSCAFFAHFDMGLLKLLFIELYFTTKLALFDTIQSLNDLAIIILVCDSKTLTEIVHIVSCKLLQDNS